MDILITVFSTVAGEAQSLGIPVILTHQNARVAFGDAIDETTIFSRDKADHFIDLLIGPAGITKHTELKSDAVTTFTQMISFF